MGHESFLVFRDFTANIYPFDLPSVFSVLMMAVVVEAGGGKEPRSCRKR